MEYEAATVDYFAFMHGLDVPLYPLDRHCLIIIVSYLGPVGQALVSSTCSSLRWLVEDRDTCRQLEATWIRPLLQEEWNEIKNQSNNIRRYGNVTWNSAVVASWEDRPHTDDVWDSFPKDLWAVLSFVSVPPDYQTVCSCHDGYETVLVTVLRGAYVFISYDCLPMFCMAPSLHMLLRYYMSARERKAVIKGIYKRFDDPIANDHHRIHS